MDSIFIIYPLLGIVAGLLAGLLGVGGGLVLVPALILIFHWEGVESARITHMAIGSSLAIIVITSVASTWTHHLKKAVEWRTAGYLAPSLMVGALGGAWFANGLDTIVLQRVFAVFELLVAIWMLGAVTVQAYTKFPGWGGQSIAGLLIGGVSGLVGIGGGTMTVPWLSWHGRSMRLAVATSAACGFPIAIAGTAGFIIFGQSESVSSSSGYIYWPAVISVSLFSLLTAPLGAFLAHQLPVLWLKRVFAILLLLAGLRLLSSSVTELF